MNRKLIKRWIQTIALLILALSISAPPARALELHTADAPVVENMPTGITISSTTVPNYRYGGTTAKLRIYLSSSFFDSNGVQQMGAPRPGSHWYLEIDCTVSGTVLSIPSFAIQSTTDSSDNPNATYTAILVDEKGIERDPFMTGFSVPTSIGLTITWEQLRLSNVKRLPINRSNTTYDNDTIDRKIAISSTTNVVPATDVIPGKGRLSRPAANVADPIIVGKNDVASTSNAGVVQLAADGETTAGKAVQGSDSRLVPSVQNVATAFNVKKYGAVGDSNLSGTGTDDTTAIQATINASVSAGRGKVYLPHGMYLVSAGLITTKPIIFEGEDQDTFLIVKNGTSNTTRILTFAPTSNADARGFQVRNLSIYSPSGTAGGYGIVLDSTSAVIANFNIQNVNIYQLGGGTIKLTNPLQVTDGIFTGTISDCFFQGAINFDYVGDSINFLRNVSTGAGTSHFTFVGGAGTPTFVGNNITQDGGWVFHSGKNILFQHNQIELQAASNTGAGGAMVQFLGDIGLISDASIKHNLIQGGGAAPSLNAFRFDNQQGSSLGDNTYTLPLGKSMLDVGVLSSFFFITEPDHPRGAGTTEVSNGMLYFYLPGVTVGAAASESGGAVWITSVKATHLVSTTDSSLEGITTGSPITSNLATGTVPFVTTNTTPTNLYARSIIYNPAGTQLINTKEVYGTTTLSGGGTATVTLSGSAVYSSSLSYTCFPTDLNSGGAVQFVPSSGSQFAFNGTAAHIVNFFCKGN